MPTGTFPVEPRGIAHYQKLLQMLNDGNLSIERDEGSWSKSKTASMDLISEFKVRARPLSG